jgi:hypothetical protein
VIGASAVQFGTVTASDEKTAIERAAVVHNVPVRLRDWLMAYRLK